MALCTSRPPVLRQAVWSATEVLGNVAAAVTGGGNRKEPGDEPAVERAAMSEAEALQRLVRACILRVCARVPSVPRVLRVCGSVRALVGPAR